MPDVKLRRCPFTVLKADALDSCYRVQRALEDQGISYEIVKEPAFPRGRRTEVIEKTGQERLPVIEFDDGSTYREESRDMAATIRAGKLFEKKAGAATQS